MENNNNLMRLLDALDHPDRYTDAELEALLDDEEARAFYETMSAAADARAYGKEEEPLATETLDAQWEQIVRGKANPATGPVMAPRRRYRAAAAIIGILMLSGIALAAVHLAVTTRRAASTQQPQTAAATAMPADTQKTAQRDTIPLGEAPAKAAPLQFDQAPLDKIVAEMATYYRVRVACHNDGAAKLRLRYLWDRSLPVEEAVETLNTFDKVNLSFADSTITIQ